MTIAEIKELESARNNVEQMNVVHFLKENNGFYRAHDWSAWLLKKFPPNELIANMSVSAKRQKDGYIDAFVGFPATSIGKYIPDAEKFGYTVVDDNHFTVTVEITTEVGEVSFENLNRQKEDWKNSLSLQESSSKKNRREDREALEQAPRATRMSDIVGRLVAIPLEEISYREAFDILRDLRRQALSLF